MNKSFACLLAFTALLGGGLTPALAQQSAVQPLDRIVAVVDEDVPGESGE